MEGKKMLKMMVLGIVVVLCAGRGAPAGEVAAWGKNDDGQCDVPEPNEGFIAVAGGHDHSLGLKQDGSIVAWGRNFEGQCAVPLPNEGFIAVAAGDFHSLGLKADGSIVAWGWNTEGQCTVPEPNEGFIAVAAGAYHSLGLKQDGSIVAWGQNSYGQCTVPLPNEGFIAVAGGYYHSLGLKEDSSIVAWGWNTEGQCTVPEPNEGFIAVAGGDFHSLGLKQDGSIVTWGHNGYGQCTVPLPNEGFIAAAGGRFHSLGLKQDGSIVAWGYNGSGQCTVPLPNEGFIAVAAGYYHSLGLKEAPMGTAFKYQGRLLDANKAADGPHDLQFELYNNIVAGIQQGTTIELDEVEVIDGYFTVQLDFGGDVFDGFARWLEIGVRPGDSNDPNAFTTLSPRQEVTPTPYALHAKTAESIAAGGYVETDPQVGAISNNYVPKWDGSALVTGTIYDNGNVGIGTTSPTSPLTVNGSIESTTNGFKFPNGTTQTTAMGSSAGYTNGLGSNPSATLAFLSPTHTVTITSSGQRIYVSSNTALGSTAAGGAANLDLYIGYRVSGSGAVPTTVGAGCWGMCVPQSTRVMMGLSAIITGLAPGTYEVGLAGTDNGNGNWNSNETGYTTAFVF